jgi:hypothetical protein
VVGEGHSDIIRLSGRCGHEEISVLLDPGSTHNFISLGLVKRQNLKIIPKNGLKVVLASGDFIRCEGCCSNLKLEVENKAINIIAYVIKLRSSELIIRVPWLKPKGKVSLDF